MTSEREQMERKLEELLPHSGARAIYLRRDDAGLARIVEKLEANRDEVRRRGTMAVNQPDLRIVEL